MIKKIASIILKFSAKIALKRNNYKIAAITGSAGKTSAKKAVILVLSEQYSVLSSEEGYNTEFGLPLILLERKVPKNKIKWFLLILVSPLLALKKKDYDFCVLEMGADRPGDIEYLTGIAGPDIAVVTNVFGAHLAEFKNIEEIAKEKEKILSNLKSGGVAVLNADDERTKKMKVPGGAKKIIFGKKSSDIQIIRQDLSEKGSSNCFKADGKDITINTAAPGEHILYVFACAIAVGISQKIELNKIIRALESFRPARSRLNLVEGINNSTIIDDTYNANPASMKNALDVLGKIDSRRMFTRPSAGGNDIRGRKIALIGSMNELGDFEEGEHKKIGTYLSGKCDILVTVGEAAEKYLAPAASKAGVKKENVFSFKDSVEAGEFLKRFIQKGDVVLAKGSQNKIRLEKAVKMLMENPDDAPKLLCRQGEEWKGRV